eukprot:TRINITY_DN9093_c0_g1_i1.p1 TRINITY_DN9093_c0_g1~~TRINITY_DN9093_c0_g1_i1.p1  ORF type:complete len:189 (-),score=36.92 TRINITY_DN9093_c0_g1_i1:9-575(-)
MSSFELLEMRDKLLRATKLRNGIIGRPVRRRLANGQGGYMQKTKPPPSSLAFSEKIPSPEPSPVSSPSNSLPSTPEATTRFSSKLRDAYIISGISSIAENLGASDHLKPRLKEINSISKSSMEFQYLREIAGMTDNEPNNESPVVQSESEISSFSKWDDTSQPVIDKISKTRDYHDFFPSSYDPGKNS